MPTKKVSFYIHHTQDNADTIDGNNYNETCQNLADSNPNFWLELNANDVDMDLCTEIDDTITSITGDFTDYMSSNAYSLDSVDFVGGRPKKRPNS